MKPARILWINPVGTDAFDLPMGRFLKRCALASVEVDIVSLPHDRPDHLEYHAYEALVTSDIVSLVHHFSDDYAAIVIACYYDVALQEAREVSRNAIVVAPCQSSLAIVSNLSNRFSILVGRSKWIPRMMDNIRAYGYGSQLASMRSLGMRVHEFDRDPCRTLKLLEKEGRRAISEDGAEAIVLGCTVEFEFQRKLAERLDVPVVDAVSAPFSTAQMFVTSLPFNGWNPSRILGCESPPDDEIATKNLFGDKPPIGNFVLHNAIE